MTAEKIKLIKEIEIMSSLFQVEYDKEGDGGKFSLPEAKITIGIKSIKTDPLYTFAVISHEIMEAVLCCMGCRFHSTRTGENYLFNFNHMEFEIAIKIHAQALSKFLK